MRLPRVRFTLRRMMVAVAVGGLLCGLWSMKRRGDHFRVVAEDHERSAKEADWFRDSGTALVPHGSLWVEMGRDGAILRTTARSGWLPPTPGEPWTPGAAGLEYYDKIMLLDQYERARDAAALHDGLAAKYHRAARYPWLPVPPDPPEPE